MSTDFSWIGPHNFYTKDTERIPWQKTLSHVCYCYICATLQEQRTHNKEQNIFVFSQFESSVFSFLWTFHVKQLTYIILYIYAVKFLATRGEII